MSRENEGRKEDVRKEEEEMGRQEERKEGRMEEGKTRRKYTYGTTHTAVL